MAEQRVTQEAAQSITSNANAAIRITQEAAQSITSNANANERMTQVYVLSITNVPSGVIYAGDMFAAAAG